MKKLFIVLLLILVGCTPHKEASEDINELGHKEQDDIINVECIHEIQTPYIDIWSPVYIESMIYMGASDRSVNEKVIDTRLLVEYNIETKKSQVIYESEYESANIQGIRVNDNWLVWEDMEISGTKDDIYVMNRKTREIKKINSISTSAPSFIIPTLVGDSVYWIEEERLADNMIQGSIKEYNCSTEKITIISQLNNIGIHNIYLERNGDRLLWSDSKDEKTYYYIYDIKTGQKDLVPASLNAVLNPILIDNYIVSMESESYSGDFELYVYNIKTKESRNNERYINGYYQFNNFILCNDGLVTSLLSIDDDLTVTTKKVFKNKTDNYTVTNGEYIAFYKRNDKGIMLYIYTMKK